MDVEGTKKLSSLYRSLLFIVPLSALLVVSLGWNIWYWRLEQTRRVQALANEQATKTAADLAKGERERARLKKRSRDAKSDARIHQLYEEIGHLTRVSEGALLPGKGAQKTNAATNSQAENAGIP
jgi:hypothetical protein